jgi:hypothetical protein
MIHRVRSSLAKIGIVAILVITSTVALTHAQPLANLALNKDAFMVRLTDSLSPASYANDGRLSTRIESTSRTVDAYWEVDLGQTYALYSIRVIAANGFAERMTHATTRLFDSAHNSVHSQKLGHHDASAFQIDLGGPRFARYVRVGLENKERTSPTGGIEWHIGITEVEVYGRDSAGIGLRAFDVSPVTAASGQPVTLTWQVEDVSELTLTPDPGQGSLMDRTNQQGFGSLVLMPDVTVEYRLIAKGSYGSHTHAQTVVVDNREPTVRINEFVAKNRVSLRDPYGDSSDWIELYNPSNATVDITGYGLSDNPNAPMKWIFPNTTMAPHSHLIVFASGRDPSHESEGGLHTPWQLDADGEHLLLTAPDGSTVIDAVFNYEAQRADLAYGRSLETNAWVFLEPTPQTINEAPSYQGWLTSPVVSHERGFYNRPFELTLQNTNPAASLMMSLNEQYPNVPLPDRVGFPISSTTTLHCAVTRPGFKSSDVVNHTYLFLEDVINSPLMNKNITQNRQYTDRLRKGLTDLPTFSITVSQLPDDYIERRASLEILWPDSSPSIQVDCGMSRYGGAWTRFAKKNYKLKFRKEYGVRKLRAPLFAGFDHGIEAVDEFDTLELRGGSHDMKARGFYMGACFVEDSMLDMGSLNPHGRFVHLYINGRYWGQFHLREQLKDTFLGDYLPGNEDDYFNVKGNDNVGSNFVPGTPDPLHRHTWESIKSLGGSYRDLKAYVDVPNLIDYMLLWFYGNSETEYRASGPVAPGDISLGFKFWLADSDGFLRTSAMGQNKTGGPGPGDFFGNLVSQRDPDFMALLSERIGMHLSPDGALGPQRATERLANRMAEIQDSLIAECARWNYRTPNNWQAAAETIYTDLFPDRASQLLGYLRDRGLYTKIDSPTFNQQGGIIESGFQLTMSAPVGIIYYTQDDGDPRAPDGSIAPTAQRYVSPDATDTLIAAGSEWSYWDKGTLPARAWVVHGYNETAWPTGPAQLGYGDNDEQTRLSFGNVSSNKHLSYYFRHHFSVTDTHHIDHLVIDLIRDDGGVGYLNGVELFRSNMPNGSVTVSTRSTVAVGGAEESTWFSYTASADYLRRGDNVLAVEIHQTSPTSSDISFDLKLGAKRSVAGEALILHTNTLIKARVWTGAQWSGLNEALFEVP